MSIITTQQVHSRNWVKCPRCDGGSLFTDRDRKQGAVCTTCDNNGEVPRFVDTTNIWFGFTERA